MKLFYSQGTSSMACVTAVREMNLDCELIEVSWSKNQNVETLNKINPLGTVPTFVHDDGTVLTQNAAVLQYLAERSDHSISLLPLEIQLKYEALSWLSFVASDFHKAFTVFFRAEDMAQANEAQAQIETFAKANISHYLRHIDSALKHRSYIAGEQFTIADCYLHVILRWSDWLDLGLNPYEHIQKYLKQIGHHKGVLACLEMSEG